MATAYHNAAVEYEFIEDFEKCIEFYEKAHDTAHLTLGGEHPLTQAFATSLIGARKKTARI